MTGIVDSFAGGAEPTMTHRQREAAMETSMRDEERAREIALGTILCGESLTALAAAITTALTEARRAERERDEARAREEYRASRKDDPRDNDVPGGY